MLELTKRAAQAPRVGSASGRCEKRRQGLQEGWRHLRGESEGLGVIAAMHDLERVGRQRMLELVCRNYLCETARKHDARVAPIECRDVAVVEVLFHAD